MTQKELELAENIGAVSFEVSANIHFMIRDDVLLRKLLWLRHGCELSALYGDDGEMQCHKCRIDFKRMPVTAIEEAFEKIGMQALIESAC